MPGKKVAIIDGEKSAGVHTASLDISRLSNSVFLYRLRVGDFGGVKKRYL